MQITLTKGSASDRIAFRRVDGTGKTFDFPKKGPGPHDAFHFFVERELGLTRGFWGLVAAGVEPDTIATMAKTLGHASAKRAVVPDESIVELLQAERLVEAFEAESWSGTRDDDGVLHMAQAGWAASHVPGITGLGDRLAAIRTAIETFAARWHGLAQCDSLELEWMED